MDLNQNGDLVSTFAETQDVNLSVLAENIDSSDIAGLVFGKNDLGNECDGLVNKNSENENNLNMNDAVLFSESESQNLVSHNEFVDEKSILNAAYSKEYEEVSLEICKNEDTNMEDAPSGEQALQLWNCPKCSSLFCDKVACLEHCEEAHNFICGLCREPCDDKQALERHIIDHIASDSIEHIQKINKNILVDASTQTDFVIIMKAQVPDTNLRQLRKSTGSKNKLNQNNVQINLASDDDDDIGFPIEKDDVQAKCEVCKKHFFSENALLLHMKNQHGDIPMRNRYKCEECGMVFQWKLYLARHITLKHGKEKVKLSFNCEICSKVFSSQKYLEHHQKLHTEILSFTCDFCDEKFGGSAEHLQHIKTAHPYSREFPCPICEKSFKSKTFLNAHTLEVHPDRCQICEKVYKSPRALEEHMLIEHGYERKKYFTCEYCGKMFSKNGSMLHHIKMYHKYSN